MNRLERLINLVAALLAAERPLSREQIEERVPGYVSDTSSAASARRSFERDKETLREMGVPLVMEPLDPTNPESIIGYRIPRDQYFLPDPDLTTDELAALHVAATTVRLEGLAGTEAIWKLGGAAGRASLAPLAALPGSEHLPALFQGVAERRVITFGYRGDPRTLEPHRLAFRDGHWYVSGFDRDRGEGRSFRSDRITSQVAVGTPQAFDRPASGMAPPPPPWEMGDDDALDARLLIEADQAPRLVAELGPGAVLETRPDGSVVVALRVTNRSNFRFLALELLDRGEVLGPQPLRDEMVAWLEAIAMGAGDGVGDKQDDRLDEDQTA